jgi:glutamyl-tRNA reductase
LRNELFYIGITHKTAPLDVRELIRPDSERQRDMLSNMSLLAGGRLVLMTCERFELYAHKPTIGARAWMETLADWFDLLPRTLEKHTQTLSGGEAAVHLLRVAAGLESRIVGEAQILGQVRIAFEQAASCNALDAELSALGRAAIRTGKRVRHETSVAKGARSIVSIASDCVTGNIAADDDERSILVVGSGKLASEVLADLTLRCVGRVRVCGRSAERTAALAARFGCEAVPFEHLTLAVRSADAAIVCTSAPTYVLNADTVEIRRTKPLVVVDLSVPRNADPMLARLPGVTVNHLDDLVRRQAPQVEAWDAAERIVDEEFEAYRQWSREREVAPFIAALVRAADVSESRGEFVDRVALHKRIVRLKAEAIS